MINVRAGFFYLAVIFLSVSANINAQSISCKNFRNGTFICKFEGNTDIIKRSGSEQLEYFNGSKKPDHYRVKWLNDCTYTLTPSAEVLAESKNLPKNIVFTVRIIKTSKDSYTQTVSDNVSNYTVTAEMNRIDFDMNLYIK